ncbi:outer membrane lipoprotein-sorting protein [Paenibacillus mendelii]|uniref:DUF4367 domain-containing protein n=1 Tax=Paenibacillus mendelii TaxID=206163 RepID=A0ABV6JC76_9BACL|nr:outer membrane lipoprotein-sorting protein [Paenibacillus mendelii]MCQ6562616.1 DUF4367 domain-containing protein [Paenibacillus mendelii]
MRRRISLIAAILLCVTAVLAACGTKDAESVVKELDKVVSGMESYQGKGTMTLHTGQQPLEYQVEVSYQQPQYYRIKLTNAKKDITQIVLRNDEGVFVLTPRLNKVFRFQSDWPANQGQVYLYQTLIQSILNDSSRQFAVDKDSYVFDVMANYQNGSLARQKIWLDKSNYRPLHVEVTDANAAVMVEVKFDQFQFDSKLDKSVFDTQLNMGNGNAEQPTMGGSDEGLLDPMNEETATPPSGSNADMQDNDAGADTNEEKPTGNDADKAADGSANGSSSGEEEPSEGTLAPADEEENAVPAGFTAMEPSYLPEGVAQLDVQDIKFGGNKGIMLRYAGAYEYTLIETQPSDVAVSMVPGIMVDLGHTLGSISGDEEGIQKTLTWTYNGIEYRLTSGTLPETEMLKVAQSVQTEMGK